MSRRTVWTNSDCVVKEPVKTVPASTDDDELTTTLAPSAARRWAVASPIPLDEPVTIATLPSSMLTPVPPSLVGPGHLTNFVAATGLDATAATTFRRNR